MTPWNSLYCPSNDAETVIQALRAVLITAGYELYDPFGLIPAKAYPQTVRTFVAPPANGWVRVIGALDDALLRPLSKQSLCLYVTLDGHTASLQVFVNGEATAPVAALLPYCRPGMTASDLDRVLEWMGASSDNMSEKSTSSAPATAPSVGEGGIPVTVLSDEVRALANNVDPKQAQKLFDRLSGHLLKRAMGEDQAVAARALIAGEPQPEWDSPDGQRIRALMDCLTIPTQWRVPDFTALRDAYPLHERRRRKPDARLYPGDAAIMNQAPDALAYTPIYGGRP